MSVSRAVAAAVVAAALILYLAPQAVGVRTDLGAPAALVVLALGLWASGALPVHVTALLLFALATILNVAPPAVIFSGFASAGLWLVFGGLVIATAIETTGLGRRLAGIVVPRLEGSYRRMIYGTIAIGVGLAFRTGGDGTHRHPAADLPGFRPRGRLRPG